MWVALTSNRHPANAAALAWAGSVSASEDFFLCRFTQLGLLRMLTNRSAMGDDVLALAQAWSALDKLLAYWGGVLLEEPSGFEADFRALTNRGEVSPQSWADAYLTAFVRGHNLTLVTFDKALAKIAKGSVLLKS